jgi:type II secretory pathway component PulM
VSDLLDRLREALANLTPREQILIGLAGATLSFVLVFTLISKVSDVAESAHAGVDSAEQQLALVKRLRRDYDEVTARLGAVEQRIGQTAQNRNVLTLLEALAATSGVKVESMEQRQAANNDRYRETKIEVELKNVTLTHMVSYLHNIEASRQLLSVKALRVKTRTDESSLLDVTFSVSSFEPI